MNLVEVLIAMSLLLTLSVAQHHGAHTTSQAWHSARRQQAALALLRRIDHLACQKDGTPSFTLDTTSRSANAHSHEVQCAIAIGNRAPHCTITPDIAGFKERIVFCAHF